MKQLILIFANILWGGLTWRLTTTPNLVIAPENLLNTLMMMGGHFTFFGIQAALLRLVSLSPVSCLTITSIYGLLIELVQLRVPGRSADPLDWLLDTLGAITFLAIMKNIKLFNKFSNF